MNVASYDRLQGVLWAIALAVASVVMLTASTPALAERVSDGLIALYDLAEGEGTTVHDSSGFGDPLDLTAIAGHQGTRWNWIPGGISILQPTIIASPDRATKLFDALTNTDDITIEAWVRPANDTQGDMFIPAEIVTMALGNNVSFTLNQMGDAYSGGVRSSGGIVGQLKTPAGAVKAGVLQHVVYTSSNDADAENIYVDDVQLAFDEATQAIIADPEHFLALVGRPQANLPWLGEIHLAAIYDQALSFAEIDQNYRMGLVPEPSSLISLLVGVMAGLLVIRARPGDRAPRQTARGS